MHCQFPETRMKSRRSCCKTVLCWFCRGVSNPLRKTSWTASSPSSGMEEGSWFSYPKVTMTIPAILTSFWRSLGLCQTWVSTVFVFWRINKTAPHSKICLSYATHHAYKWGFFIFQSRLITLVSAGNSNAPALFLLSEQNQVVCHHTLSFPSQIPSYAPTTTNISTPRSVLSATAP